MQTFRTLSEVPSNLSDTAVTIGKFDCLHLGHQSLFAEVIAYARQNQLAPTIVTFDRHPDHLLRPDRAKAPILGRNQKHEMLNQSGADYLLELEFNQELADKTPEQFAKQILVDTLRAKKVMVGEGFRFGNQGSGNAQTLRELGQLYDFEVREVNPVEVDGEMKLT